MPIITVKGVPEGLDVDTYDGLKHRIRVAVSESPNIGEVPVHEVEVFLVPDLGSPSQSLVAEVSGIFRLPHRTPEVFAALHESICAVLREFADKSMPSCLAVEAETAFTMRPSELILYLRKTHGLPWGQLRFEDPEEDPADFIGQCD